MKLNAKNKCVWMAMAIALLLMVWGASTGCSHQKPAPQQPSLYERLGGINNIAVVMDDIIERAYADPVFAANPKIHAAHLRFPKAAYKYNATALACQAMGGPQVYTGRSLKASHQHLGITEKEWTALIKMFHDSMDSFKVPAKEQAEIIAILEASKADVMAPGAQ